MRADTAGMRWLGTRILAVALAAVVPTLTIPSTPVAAGTSVLTFSDVSGPSASVSSNDTQTVQASCPPGQMPITGYVTASAPDDVRRLFETFDLDSRTFLVGVVNFGPNPLQVTATARCVERSRFGTITTVSGVFDAAADHVAEGTVTCPAGHVAINASVTEPHSQDRTLLTSAPTWDLQQWTARAWVGEPDDPDEVMTIDAHCVESSTLPGLYGTSFQQAVGWGVPASHDCPSGLVPIFGGTNHVGGDRGAITVHQRPTATGWSSTTLSLSDGTMRTTVACVPGGYPSIGISGSTGFTNSPSATWSFTASDPADDGGYDLEYFCSFDHPGITIPPASCTSPVNRTGLGDGVHKIRVYARTSDGRESPTAEAVVTVDTVAPTVTMSAPPVFHTTTSATPTWAGFDATAGVARYELRRRRTALLGEVGAWTTPVSLPASTTSRTYGSLIQGSTYCYSVRAVDAATNAAPWASRCTAIPLDDRALNRSVGWAEANVTGWFQGTAMHTTTRGAFLTKSATTRRIAVVALKCPTCGSIGVYAAGTLVGTINLAASTARRQLISLPAFALTTGTVMLKVLSDGKLVRIDALSLSRF